MLGGDAAAAEPDDEPSDPAFTLSFDFLQQAFRDRILEKRRFLAAVFRVPPGTLGWLEETADAHWQVPSSGLALVEGAAGVSYRTLLLYIATEGSPVHDSTVATWLDFLEPLQGVNCEVRRQGGLSAARLWIGAARRGAERVRRAVLIVALAS